MNQDLSLYPNRHALDPAIWYQRGVSCAYRLLCGLGQAEMVAYHADPVAEFTAIAHGVTRTGDLVVAVSANDPALVDLDGELPEEVRLSIEKHAPRLDLHVVAASIHLLGQARWADRQEKELLIAAGDLPDRVAALAQNGELAVISYHRALLHDACGVTPVIAEKVEEEHQRCSEIEEHAFFCNLESDLFTHPEHELMTADAVNNAFIMDLLYDGLTLGTLNGAFLASQPVTGVCDHSLGMTCLDVDRTGLTLMCIETSRAVTAFIPFENEVSTLRDLLRELQVLGQLAGNSLMARRERRA